jgi:hypothetical protein
MFALPLDLIKKKNENKHIKISSSRLPFYLFALDHIVTVRARLLVTSGCRDLTATDRVRTKKP